MQLTFLPLQTIYLLEKLIKRSLRSQVCRAVSRVNMQRIVVDIMQYAWPRGNSFLTILFKANLLALYSIPLHVQYAAHHDCDVVISCDA